jgi:CDP-diacylglycerol--glycerol-3-phosphate 3-phosphatidyltransferase
VVWTLPNLLSLFRIGIIPVLVYLLTFNDRVSAVLAALLFLIASITDYFDGYLARRNRSVSDLGKILDPLADKLMVIAALIMLTAMDRGNQVCRLGRDHYARKRGNVIRGIALSEGIYARNPR